MRSALIVSIHFKCGASCIICLERIRIRKTPLELSFFFAVTQWDYVKIYKKLNSMFAVASSRRIFT